jgi:hypothetical protein
VAVSGYTSVADDVVVPRWLQVPKWESATASGQRSAAQNGQDSSLTKTMAGLPPMVNSGSDVLTVCSGVTTWPGLTLASTAPGTVVTCLTTAEGACDSLATKRAGVEVRLTSTSATTKPTTAVIDAIANKIRRRASARLRAARSAATSSRARILGCGPRGGLADLPPARS